MSGDFQHIKSFFFMIVLCTLGELSIAQDMGPYILPFKNKPQDVSNSVRVESVQDFVNDFFKDYQNLELALLYEKQSLGGVNYTFQCRYGTYPIEQVLVKILVDFNNHPRLLQTTLPLLEEWNTIHFNSNESDENLCYILLDDTMKLVRKELGIQEEKDYYAHRFWINDEVYFENILKYHNDTTAYAKVFQPDPLTSANVLYGGSYQDALRFDTTALVIQNLNNTGNTTITANGINFSYDGLTFNVPTESYINNFSAPIIQQVFENIFLDGNGNILGFNTAITEDLSNYTTEIIIEDYNYPSLAQEQVWGELPVDFSGGSFNLVNADFIISEFSLPFTNPANSATDSFDFTRNLTEFEDVNAFYHLNNFKSYWESLGFTNLASEVILVDAHGNNGADNSFFTPTSPPRLVFGEGGVDDAEDADVIIHEYGHAISAFAAPETNSGDERRALDEGFGDYLATTYSRQYDNFEANKVFSWDGHNEFWAGRISNSNKTKLDLSSNQNIYFNGEIWSAVLNDLYLDLGATVADQLAIEVMYYNMPNSSLTQAAFNLFLADTLLFNGVHTCSIFNILLERKFVEGTCNDFYSGVREYKDSNKPKLFNTYGFSYLNEGLVLELKEFSGEKVVVSLYDLKGQLLSESQIEEQVSILYYEDLAPGIYFLHIRTAGQNYPFKLVKN